MFSTFFSERIRLGKGEKGCQKHLDFLFRLWYVHSRHITFNLSCVFGRRMGICITKRWKSIKTPTTTSHSICVMNELTETLPTWVFGSPGTLSGRSLFPAEHKFKLIRFQSSPVPLNYRNALRSSTAVAAWVVCAASVWGRSWKKWIWRAHSTTTIYIFIFYEHFAERALAFNVAVCCASAMRGKTDWKLENWKRARARPAPHPVHHVHHRCDVIYRRVLKLFLSINLSPKGLLHVSQRN